MKKIIQTLACAAIMAVAGFNAWAAFGGDDKGSELQIGGVEACAQIEGINIPRFTLQWYRTKVSGTIGGGVSRKIKKWVCKYMQQGTGDGNCHYEGETKTEYI